MSPSDITPEQWAELIKVKGPAYAPENFGVDGSYCGPGAELVQIIYEEVLEDVSEGVETYIKREFGPVIEKIVDETIRKAVLKLIGPERR